MKCKLPKKERSLNQKKSKHIVTKNMIAEAAYYKAKQREFAPGLEKRDWLQAEIDLVLNCEYPKSNIIASNGKTFLETIRL